MKATRKFFGLGIMVYLVLASVALLGMLGSALAGGSQSLVLENAEGESLTVGSVSAETNGTNIILTRWLNILIYDIMFAWRKEMPGT
jgi:hypothetical protein